MERKITGGDKEGALDYFLKEAHSDGDEKNLFRMSKKVRVQVGESSENGKGREQVLLIYPAGDGESALISNQQFGRWVRDRATPLVYFNTSCNSKTKAINEIMAAGKQLINICSDSSIAIFFHSELDATHQLLLGFLEGKDYTSIRSLMQNDERYKNGISQQYMFPDEPRYKEKVTDFIRIPLDIEVTLTDGFGERVIFDERIRHER